MSRGIRKIILAVIWLREDNCRSSLSWPLEDIFELERKAWAASEGGGVFFLGEVLLAE